MKINKELKSSFESVKEWGDVEAISQLLKIDKSVASRILSGQRHTSLENLMKIKAFVKERKRVIKQLS